MFFFVHTYKYTRLSRSFKPKLHYSCTFPIDLEPNGIMIGAKSIRELQLRPKFDLFYLNMKEKQNFPIQFSSFSKTLTQIKPLTQIKSLIPFRQIKRNIVIPHEWNKN